MDLTELHRRAFDAASRAYAPYSKFRVGAALLCSDGTVFTGVNVENRSFGLTVCAERGAVSAAVEAGRKEFVAVAVATPDADYPVSPCGACRQVLTEFAAPGFVARFGNAPGSFVVAPLENLLPHDALHELAGPGR